MLLHVLTHVLNSTTVCRKERQRLEEFIHIREMDKDTGYSNQN